MSGLTSRARNTLGALALVAVLAMAPARPVHADAAGDAILGSILAWLTTIGGAAITFMEEQLARYYIHLGNQAITQQVAANTLGVQSALQANAATAVESTNVQTQKLLEHEFKSTFGSFGRYGNITIGSNAPFACRRQADAGVLAQGRVNLPDLQQQAKSLADTHDRGYGSASGALAHLKRDVDTYGPSTISLDWLNKDKLSSDDISNAWRSINYATNPSPPPAPPAAANSAAAKEYAADYDRYQEMMKVPQQVLARQAGLRASIATDPDRRSYLGVLSQIGQVGVEDPQHPVALQAKTEAGVQRDIALSMQALLSVETERLKTEQETAAMTALMLSNQLQQRGDALAKKYATTVVSD